jgi:lipopolysaccharide/colanic/teichoic acid biosynthesis glycosyltransferase
MATTSGFNVYPIFERRKLSTTTIDPSFYYASKRIVDIVFSGLFLLAASPVLAIVALLIKLDSPGPVFFKQTRVGSRMYKFGPVILWKREYFSCYKFRTMHHNSNNDVHKAYMKALISADQKTMKEMEGEKAALHKLVNDNRITRIGKFLRKTSIDEIPQFINVFKGEMSVVGPRPAIPYEVDMYNPWFLRRLEAKPGVTGLQQITARCTECFDQQVRLDIQYIQNQSFWFDIKIMLKTPLAIFTQKGV